MLAAVLAGMMAVPTEGQAEDRRGSWVTARGGPKNHSIRNSQIEAMRAALAKLLGLGRGAILSMRHGCTSLRCDCLTR